MRRLALAALFLAGLTVSACAQSIEGNWNCSADGQPGGLLTIYGGSYTFASLTFGDARSGSGAVNWDENGPIFADGPLATAGGVQYGLPIRGGEVFPMDLIARDTVAFSCVKRQRGLSTGLPVVPDAPPPPSTDPAPAEAPIPLQR